MTPPITLYETALTSLSLKARGKVRDIYNIDEEHMLIVTTDRLSAFDVILPDPFPARVVYSLLSPISGSRECGKSFPTIYPALNWRTR